MQVLHLDMDSYFATVEQQARPQLRGKPVGISIAPSRGGTIIAASIEAKRYGIKTGTRVGEARMLYPDITLIRPNPARYRDVHKRVKAIMADYTPEVRPRSIDEIAIWLSDDLLAHKPALDSAAEIKHRIREEVGDWLSSSVGIGPNWWLAKTASDFDKPDGLFELTRENTRQVMDRLGLRDLCGINYRMEARLQLLGIATPVDLYDADPVDLKRKLGIVGYYWYRRLHGYALDTAERQTRTMGHSSVIPKPTANPKELKSLLAKLCERTARRMRTHRWQARHVSVFTGYARGSEGRPGSGPGTGSGEWRGQRTVRAFSDGAELFRHAWDLFGRAKLSRPIRIISVRAGKLLPATPEQPELWPYRERRRRAVAAADAINDKWGELTMHSAEMLGTEQVAQDSIAFGQDLAHPQEPIHIRQR